MIRQRLRVRLFRLINILQRSDMVPESLRRSLLRAAGVKVRSARIVSDVSFTFGCVEIADGAFVNQGTLIDASAPVRIGRNVHIAPRCNIVTATHELGDGERRAGRLVCAPIEIREGTWIGAAVTVLPGVTIAEGCVVAAGAVVKSDTLPNSLYAGVPAVWKRALKPLANARVTQAH